MKLKIFSVFDAPVGAYLQPFFCRSNGEAIRSFQDACNDGKTQFAQHPNDYTLFYLGEWDDTGGVLDTSTPARVGSAAEMIVKAT